MPVVLLQGVLIALIGYLWGSIPAGYWMGKLLRGKNFDIRDYGSHKIGSTNVLRTLGRGPAGVVFVFDLSKGILPTLLALHVAFFYLGQWGPAIAGLCALLGHCFPIFIGFKGGRGVMTGAGVMLVLSPLTLLIASAVAFSAIAISRYVSLGSILGALTGIICGLVFYFIGLANSHFFAAIPLPSMLYLVIGPALVILFHRDNIDRLLSGNERKIGQKVKIEENNTSASTPNTPNTSASTQQA